MSHPTRRADQVRVGDKLPELRLPITRTLIVAGALATRDFEDVHHDPDLAIARGTPDIYMSINNSNGLVSRYVTDWTGPGARLTSLSTRLGVPNFPGGALTMAGEVTAVDGDLVTVTVAGTTGTGAHVTSTVRVRLPRQREVES
ncbi:MaoC family dehydratase [Dactylosporangium fulvum]|uniref:Acyl dehydratase n=1 Tax=Dactylosporangium fulvum TaxID=53359 RepID=A0ABY5W8I4_9ACTN|nr:acyl dehydratase [Dactylosporangium fulvum]UWP85319.1 acyl dehydratase [Dactylosporangium fulvum]